MPEERSDGEKEAYASDNVRADFAAPTIDAVESSLARESWLLENDIAMKSILQGLLEAAAGEVHDIGTFVQCVTDDDADSDSRDTTHPSHQET